MQKPLMGPGIFLAQGYGKRGWKTIEECAASAAALGYKGMQVPLWIDGLINLEMAAASHSYCDDLHARARATGCPIVETANHVQTQLVRCAPAYQALFEGFAPKRYHGDPVAVAEWAEHQTKLSVAATKNLGFDRMAAFSGSSIFHLVYPWPQRPKGLVNAAFHALASAWNPIFKFAEQLGVDICFELHPGEDLMDGGSFNRFLRFVNNHPRCNILLDLSHFALAGMKTETMLEYIRKNAGRIKMFHVKDGELLPNADGAAYCGYADWPQRQGRFRSTGDGQIQYLEVFNLLKELGLDLWAILEWEDCAGKGWNQGAREGALYIQNWIDGKQGPECTAAELHDDGAFDDFAATPVNTTLIASILGIPESEVCTDEPVAA